MAKALDRPILVGSDFAQALGDGLVSVGLHHLRGFAMPHELFECRWPQHSLSPGPPLPEPRAVLPAGRHDRRPRQIRRRADRAPSAPAGNRASSTGSRGWRARPPILGPTGQARGLEARGRPSRYRSRSGPPSWRSRRPRAPARSARRGSDRGRLQPAVGKLRQTRIQPLVHCADRGSRKAVAAQLLGDRLHPGLREGRLLRVETPCTYISASAATSARSDR
jgi:hypothetical protein